MRLALMFAMVPPLLACGGGGGRPATTPRDETPALRPQVTEQRWYRSRSMCGQGPYELEIPVAGGRWGEEFELRLHAPHAVELKAVVLADDDEVGRAAGVYRTQGAVNGPAQNTRCVAGARERLALGRGGGGGGAGGGAGDVPGTPGVTVVTPPDAPTPPPSPAAPLELDGSLVTSSTMVVRFGWREGDGRVAAPPRTIRVRFWSISPNDLEGVLFGVARIEWRPNVSDAAYVAHVEAEAARAAARAEAEQRRREAEWERRQAAQPAPPPARPVSDAERARIEAEARARAEARRRQWQAEQEAEMARLARANRESEEAARRREIAAALAAERQARRAQFCATHPEDRGCWGAGGLQVHLELERRRQERGQYCQANPEDVRCWDGTERARRKQVWQRRIDVALAPPRQPDGPPPAALDEPVPPKLSLNAEWRPGYWHWSGASWFWIAGMWRVPESDIAAEQTTVAPAAPPAPQVEQPPPAPVVAAVWVPGFWQWSGTAWVWVAGSWQLRPEVRATWRAPEWQVRGNVHVLIPGAWIGGRR